MHQETYEEHPYLEEEEDLFCLCGIPKIWWNWHRLWLWTVYTLWIPLVNIQKAIENGHLQGVFPLKWWWILCAWFFPSTYNILHKRKDEHTFENRFGAIISERPKSLIQRDTWRDPRLQVNCRCQATAPPKKREQQNNMVINNVATAINVSDVFF